MQLQPSPFIAHLPPLPGPFSTLLHAAPLTTPLPPPGEADWHPDKRRLHEFIVRSFLACCSLDAVGYETAVTVDIAGGCMSEGGGQTGGIFPHPAAVYILRSPQTGCPTAQLPLPPPSSQASLSVPWALWCASATGWTYTPTKAGVAGSCRSSSKGRASCRQTSASHRCESVDRYGWV